MAIYLVSIILIGATEQTLKVLTVIHNFDLKRDDDTTAAQRLFGNPFRICLTGLSSTWASYPDPGELKSSHLQKPTVQAVLS